MPPVVSILHITLQGEFRLFHGSADDYNPVSYCRAYVERLRQAGKDIAPAVRDFLTTLLNPE